MNDFSTIDDLFPRRLKEVRLAAGVPCQVKLNFKDWRQPYLLKFDYSKTHWQQGTELTVKSCYKNTNHG